MCDPSVEREGASQAGRNQKALCSLRQTTQTRQAGETEGAEEAGEVGEAGEVREGGAAAAEKEAGKGERNFPQKQSQEKPANNFFFLLPVAAYWPQLTRLVLVVVVRS